MANVLGPPVVGEDFFGREAELAYIIRKLLAGNHILLTAPRRVGKTSFALKVLELIRKRGWEGVFVDVEGAQDELMAVQEIIKAIQRNKTLWQKVGKSVSDLLSRLNIEVKAGGFGSVKIGSSKAAQADQLLEQLGEILLSIENPFLLVVDELPVFLLHLQSQENGLERVRNFLHRLRAYRIAPQQADGKRKKLSWFFCGSIGLENYALVHSLSSTINDLLPYQIGAFKEEEAVAFLKVLSQQEDLPLTEENIRYLIRKTGWPIPYYLRLIVEEVIKTFAGNGPITELQIEQAYAQAIRSNRSVLDLWVQRLRQQLTKEQFEKACQMLNQVAKAVPRTFDQLKAAFVKVVQYNIKLNDELATVLNLLVNEGYLIFENETYAFRSPFVRDWWKLRNHL
ncbi:MAG: ATP-binding protein [Bacteroidota bacterium]